MADQNGIYEYLTVDGDDLAYNPQSLAVDIRDSASDVETFGDSYRFNRALVAGLPDRELRFAFELPFDGLTEEANLRTIRRLQAKPGEFSFAYWKPVNFYYTATSGQVSFYLPRHRRYAAAALSKSTTDFPFNCWVNEVAQTVAVVAGNSPTTPASGNCNVGTTAKTSGTYLDYVEFRLAACTAGDIVEVEFAPLFTVRVASQSESYPDTTLEQRGLSFIER